MDISANGAKIISTMPSQVADRFELAFTKGDGRRRRCEVVWRRGKVIGVQFEESQADRAMDSIFRAL